MDIVCTPNETADFTLPCKYSGVAVKMRPITMALYRGKGNPMIMEQTRITGYAVVKHSGRYATAITMTDMQIHKPAGAEVLQRFAIMDPMSMPMHSAGPIIASSIGCVCSPTRYSSMPYWIVFMEKFMNAVTMMNSINTCWVRTKHQPSMKSTKNDEILFCCEDVA